MRKKLGNLEKEEPGLRLSDEAISDLLEQKTDVLRDVQSIVSTIIGDELSKPVRTGDLSTVRYEVERKIRLADTIPAPILQTVLTIGRLLVVETETINEEATQAGIERARAAVEPTRILQGQVIVREGQMIDGEIYRQLELTGLLTNQSTVKPFAGLSLFVLFISAIIFLHFNTWQRKWICKEKSIADCSLSILSSCCFDETDITY